jgi:hypothetical protein
MHAVSDKGQRPERNAANDFDEHHGAAEDDHRPGSPFGMLMAFAKEDVAMGRLSQRAMVVMIVVVVIAVHEDHFR